MNYTGYGQDPNFIRSFRKQGSPSMETMAMGRDGFRQLRESLAYKQSGMEGKRRMERLATMGLPVNTDINKIQQVGYDPSRRQPIYQAPRPQSWGTYGSVGGEGKRKEPSPTEITQSPSLTKATQINESELGQRGDPLAFTGFGQMARNQKADQYQTPIGRGGSSMPSTSPTLAAAGVRRFPFAGAESAFERGTRTATAGTNVRMPTAAFGNMPMFPSSRFGGPQPNERTGPFNTQPRRSWMY